MHFSTLAASLLAVGLAAAQISDIPSCAIECFVKSAAESSCSSTDYYCQCTTGAKVIGAAVIKCLCEDSTCSASELVTAGDASDGICSSALAASGQTYTPTTYPTNECALISAGSTGTSAASSSSSSSSASSSSGSSSASSSAVSTTTSSSTSSGSKTTATVAASTSTSSSASSASAASTAASSSASSAVSSAPAPAMMTMGAEQWLIGGMAVAAGVLAA